ncbi:hypothetical protein F4824DRAFT_495490 [Ustulina deusta]|nr:hypothetical protein F4824DRAFT_495490 [Ustulina deusta]
MTGGLSEEQVVHRTKEHGRNAPSPPKSNALQTWLGYLFKGFGPVLLIGAINFVFISWKPLRQPPALANLALAIVLVAVSIIQATFNAFQDWSSSRVMSSIKSISRRVSRHLKQRTGVTARERACLSSDANLYKSILTAANVDSTDDNYLESRCMWTQGTQCVSSSCTSLVVATGDCTTIRRIAAATQEPKAKLTTLENEILYFVIIICSIMLTVITITLGFWLKHDHPDCISVPTLIVDIVGVAIAFIPKGFSIALTA